MAHIGGGGRPFTYIERLQKAAQEGQLVITRKEMKRESDYFLEGQKKAGAEKARHVWNALVHLGYLKPVQAAQPSKAFLEQSDAEIYRKVLRLLPGNKSGDEVRKERARRKASLRELRQRGVKRGSVVQYQRSEGGPLTAVEVRSMNFKPPYLVGVRELRRRPFMLYPANFSVSPALLRP